MIRNARRASKLLACTMLAGACATGAQANWFASYSGPTSYWAKFTKVPDFDQVRDGLPNNGNMYCVPTSAVNWMAYIAHHGYPTIMPGDHTQYFWHSQSNFNLSNIFLNIMGNYMATDPFDGTYGGPAKAGLDTWLDNRFVVIHRWLNNSETPRFDDIAAYTRLKIPVMACVGWYSDNDGTLTRNGGHCFSVVKVQREGSTRLLTMHDPADEQTNIFTQSAVAERTYEIDPRIRVVGGQIRVIDKLVDYGSGYLDTYFAIVPLYGLATSADFTDLILLKPYKFSFDDDPIISRPIPAPGPIVDLVPAPHAPWSLVATTDGQGLSVLWKYSPDEERFEEIVQAEQVEQIEFDRFGRIYIVDGRTIRCYSPFDGVYEEEASVVPGAPVLEMAFDDRTDMLYAVLEDRTVRQFGAGLQEVGGLELPQDLILGGKVAFDTSPVDGSLFITSEESPGVYHQLPAVQRQAPQGWELIAEGAVDIPQSISLADGPCLMIVDSQCIAQVWCYDQIEQVWYRDAEHPMDGKEVGKNVRMAYSRSNYEPEIHATPEFNNILPPEQEIGAGMGCFADLNDDNVVDGADLGLLLGAWGPEGETVADLNGDGVVDGADLGLLLGNWGDCPV